MATTIAWEFRFMQNLPGGPSCISRVFKPGSVTQAFDIALSEFHRMHPTGFADIDEIRIIRKEN